MSWTSRSRPTGAQLERICRGLRKATAPKVEHAAGRRVRARALGSGLVKLEVVVSPDEADLLICAIEQAREKMTPASPPVTKTPAKGTRRRHP